MYLWDYGALLAIVCLILFVLVTIANGYLRVLQEMAQANIRVKQEMAQAILDQNERFHKRVF